MPEENRSRRRRSSQRHGQRSKTNDSPFGVLTFLLLIGIVGILFISLRPSRTNSDPTSFSTEVDRDHPIAKSINIRTPLSPDKLFPCILTMTARVNHATDVQLFSTDKSLVTDSTQIRFPTSVTIPKDEDHVTLILHTGSPDKDTKVTIAAGAIESNMRNSDSWDAEKEIIIQGTSTQRSKNHPE